MSDGIEIPELNVSNGAQLLAGAGALNVGLESAAGMTVVTDLLGTGGAETAMLAAGAGGAVVLLEQFDVADLAGD